VVVSSFMFHHLSREVKANTLREVRRVLKPGGRFHMVDFAGPGSGHRGFLARRIHTSHHLQDNDEERVLAFLRDAGLADARVVARRAGHLGGMAYYQATAPASA
jgi:ubiquinone/menaquinone biosynthesis C-methylase UbiE